MSEEEDKITNQCIGAKCWLSFNIIVHNLSQECSLYFARMSISKKNCSWATEAIMQDSAFATLEHLPCLNKSTSPRALDYFQHLNLVTADLIDNCQSSTVPFPNCSLSNRMNPTDPMTSAPYYEGIAGYVRSLSLPDAWLTQL